ncbi:MAG: hypothetical protein GY714_20150 [Desulfobacterales bacterium]|nr:hypothetical protein [Desulfobacterales bacterium]
MKFKCIECGAASCYLENSQMEKDTSPFTDPQPKFCAYTKNSIEAIWVEIRSSVCNCYRTPDIALSIRKGKTYCSYCKKEYIQD